MLRERRKWYYSDLKIVLIVGGKQKEEGETFKVEMPHFKIDSSAFLCHSVCRAKCQPILGNNVIIFVEDSSAISVFNVETNFRNVITSNLFHDYYFVLVPKVLTILLFYWTVDFASLPAYYSANPWSLPSLIDIHPVTCLIHALQVSCNIMVPPPKFQVSIVTEEIVSVTCEGLRSLVTLRNRLNLVGLFLQDCHKSSDSFLFLPLEDVGNVAFFLSLFHYSLYYRQQKTWRRHLFCVVIRLRMFT